jgi:hypothetical protein
MLSETQLLRAYDEVQAQDPVTTGSCEICQAQIPLEGSVVVEDIEGLGWACSDQQTECDHHLGWRGWWELYCPEHSEQVGGVLPPQSRIIITKEEKDGEIEI